MKKKRGSLEKRVIKALFFGAAALTGLVSVATLLLYNRAYLRDQKSAIENYVEYAVSMLDDAYLKKLYETTRTRYEEGEEAPGEDSFSEAYLEYLSANPALEDDAFWKSREVLEKCREYSDLDSLALCFLDEEKKRMVFVLDGDPIGVAYYPGNWLDLSDYGEEPASSTQKIMDSSWRMKVDYSEIVGLVLGDFVEVRTKDGEVLGMAVASENVSEVLLSDLWFLLFFVLGFLMILYIMSFFVLRFFGRRIFLPVKSLSETAIAYAARDKAGSEEETTFFQKLPLRTGDEIETLWESLSDMERDINDTMKRIRKVTSERERLHAEKEIMNAELGFAKRIQEEQLPSEFPAFPDRKDFDIYASMTTAKEVGGDFYDFFLTDEDHIAMVIADVSDKGVPAALFMMMAKMLLKAELKNGKSPAQAFRSVNERLIENNAAMQFVTIWAAVLDLRTGEGLASNAGHEKPVLKRAGEKYKIISYRHYFPLAMSRGEEYEDHAFSLQPGDSLFVYTDGVVEANNEKKELFGDGRMLLALNKAPDAPPDQVIRNVKEEIDAFTGEAEQFDDITMLCFHRS